MIARSVGIAFIVLFVLGFLLDAAGRYPSDTVLAAFALLVLPALLGLVAFLFRRLTRTDQ